jgi:hypothetical protein
VKIVEKKEKKEREKGGPPENHTKLAEPIVMAVKVVERWKLNQSIATKLLYNVVSSELKIKTEEINLLAQN